MPDADEQVADPQPPTVIHAHEGNAVGAVADVADPLVGHAQLVNRVPEGAVELGHRGVGPAVELVERSGKLRNEAVAGEAEVRRRPRCSCGAR